jgi:hypothetical protein
LCAGHGKEASKPDKKEKDQVWNAGQISAAEACNVNGSQWQLMKLMKLQLVHGEERLIPDTWQLQQ